MSLATSESGEDKEKKKEGDGKTLRDIYDELEKLEPKPKTPSVELDPADVDYNRE